MVGRVVRVVGALTFGGALAVGAYFLATGRMTDNRPLPTLTSTQRGLLADWEAWRRAPLRFTETTKRASGDQQLTQSVTVSQRFPDQVVRDGSSVSARVGGRAVGCGAVVAPSTTAATSASNCRTNGSVDAATGLDAELEALASKTSSGGAYRLSRTEPGCYRLRHVIDEFRPSYGDRTDYCFDGTTHLLAREVTVLGDLTITTTRTDVAAPTDQDFVVPGEP